MSTARAIRNTDCSSLGTFTDELLRLESLGFRAAPHSDVARLQAGEFLVQVSTQNSRFGAVSICYRE